MEKKERKKTSLEADLEECREILEGLAKGPFEMYEFSDELKFAVQDMDDVLEHAFWYEMLASKKSGKPMSFQGDEEAGEIENTEL